MYFWGEYPKTYEKIRALNLLDGHNTKKLTPGPINPRTLDQRWICYFIFLSLLLQFSLLLVSLLLLLLTLFLLLMKRLFLVCCGHRSKRSNGGVVLKFFWVLGSQQRPGHALEIHPARPQQPGRLKQKNGNMFFTSAQHMTGACSSDIMKQVQPSIARIIQQ